MFLLKKSYICIEFIFVMITKLDSLLKEGGDMEAIERLLEFQIKPSVQRIAVMDYLMKNRTHPSVDDIYSHLSPSMPTLSKTTVYNTLKLFADCGAILALTIDEKNTNYDAETSDHGHFLCKRCGKIYDFDCHPSLVNGLKKEGFEIQETHYYYKGVCKNCLE